MKNVYRVTVEVPEKGWNPPAEFTSERTFILEDADAHQELLRVARQHDWKVKRYTVDHVMSFAEIVAECLEMEARGN